MKLAPFVAFVVGLAFCAVVVVVTPAQSQPTVSFVKQLDDGSYLITVDGQQHWAVNVAKTKELKATELKLRQGDIDLATCNANLQIAKDNVQDERVRLARMEAMHGDQVKLATECFSLLKKDGGRFKSFMDKPVVQLLRDVVPSVAQMATCK